jgi:hypothetical protein
MSDVPRSAIAVFQFRAGLDAHGVLLKLTPSSINAVYGNNQPKQLFQSTDGPNTVVAIRFTQPIRHSRMERLLQDLESRFGVQFQKLPGLDGWRSHFRMGGDLHTSDGKDMMDLLRLHHRINHPSFSEYLLPGHHLTHMIRDPLRENRNFVPAAGAVPALGVVHQEAPVPLFSPALLIAGQAVPALAVAAAGVVLQDAPVPLFSPALLIAGQPNRVEEEVAMTERILGIVMNLFGVAPGPDLLQRIRAELERAGGVME